MKEFWICLLLASAVVVNAQKDESYEDIWEWYDNYDDLPKVPAPPPEEKGKTGELQNDYLIEDNRPAVQEETKKLENEAINGEDENQDDVVSKEGEVADQVNGGIEEIVIPAEIVVQGEEDTELKEAAQLSDEVVNENADENLNVNDDEKTQLEDIPEEGEKLASNNDAVIQETRAILEKDEGNDFADDKVDDKAENPEIDAVVEETQQILKETDDNFEAESGEDTADADNDENVIEEIAEDTVDKVYQDLNEDLKKLQETFNKLSSDVEPEKNADDSFDPSRIDEYSDKFDYSGERRVLAMRDYGQDDTALNYDYEQFDANAEEPVENNPNDDEETKNVEEEKQDADVAENAGKNDDETNDEEFSNDDDSIDEVAALNINDEAVDADTDILASADTKKAKTVQEPEVVTEKIAESTTANTIEIAESTTARLEENPTIVAARKINVTDLTPEQYDQVMAQFRLANREELDVANNDLDRNVAAVHKVLSVNEATVVTSPNYPEAYPPNNVVDWIFTGDGSGIELNITDFFVNGAIGDYLLVIPGGLDSSSTDGLVFSYRLRDPRRYRFFDVDRMFVRFVSNLGMRFATGFSFSARMISERVELPEGIPHPEPVLPEPTETLTLHIGGLTLNEFRNNQEAFREIIADMATLYINSNGIPAGLNTTIEVTQIARTAVCNNAWPDYTNCAQVVFGVPLVYEGEEEPRLTEGDLRAMWYLYSNQDPFASRLRSLNMMEFVEPDDSVLIVWLVLGLGVVVCSALLSFALWRFSCFQNYTRMPELSDRDSVCSKRTLDLYPTPHQTLPPLFDGDYKWDDGKYEDDTRVDMGGFTNKVYSRDMYDIESDEDVVAPRDRKIDIAPKNKLEV